MTCTNGVSWLKCGLKDWIIEREKGCKKKRFKRDVLENEEASVYLFYENLDAA